MLLVEELRRDRGCDITVYHLLDCSKKNQSTVDSNIQKVSMTVESLSVKKPHPSINPTQLTHFRE